MYDNGQRIAALKNDSRNNVISLRNICLVVFMTYVVYATDSLLIATNQNQQLLVFSQYFITLIAIFYLMAYFVKSAKISIAMLWLFEVVATLILSMLVNGDITGGYIFKISLLIFGFFFTYFIEQERFIDFYIKLMRIIAVLSLIGLFFARAIMEMDIFPVVTNVSGINFTSLFFTNIPHYAYYIRNFGSFWEPGVYQAYLFVALFFVLFCRNQLRKMDVLLFSLTIVSTFSTTGFFALATLLFGYIMSKQTNGKKSIKWLVLMVIVLIVLYVLFTEEASQVFFNKLRLGTDSPSFSSRWNAIWANIAIFLKHPLFGVGPNGMLREQVLYLKTVTQTGTFFNTNTLLFHFAVYGVTLGCYYMVLIYKLVRKYACGFLAISAILLGFFIIFSGENFTYSLFFNTIIFFGLKERHQRNCDTKRKTVYKLDLLNYGQ